MERPNTIAGLMAKRKQLQAELAQAEKAAKAIRIDLDHLDATLRLFTEDAPRSIPRHVVQHRAQRGEMQRHVLAMLREADAPLTSEAITHGWCKARGMQADHDTHVMLRKRVGACLNSLKHQGRVEDVPMNGQYKGWVRGQTPPILRSA